MKYTMDEHSMRAYLDRSDVSQEEKEAFVKRHTRKEHSHSMKSIITRTISFLTFARQDRPLTESTQRVLDYSRQERIAAEIRGTAK